MIATGSRLRIAFLIRALTPGGAERQLALLAKGLADRGHEVTILVFYGGGALERDLERSTVRVVDLHKGGRWDVFGFMRRLTSSLKRANIDVLHSYLPSANIVAAFARVGASSIPVVWGLRASEMKPESYDWLGRLVAATETAARRGAQGFVCNSRAGLELAARRGYPRERIRFIRNGIDLARFRRDTAAARQLREQWGVQAGERLIGIVGRIDPMKGHSVFLQAAAHARSRDERMKLVVVGTGAADQIQALQSQAQQLGVATATIWAGARSDMPAIYSSLDVLCSASGYGEGTSNVIAEAMACGCPCVATNVGDCAELVGRFGRVVEAGEPRALGEALLAIDSALTDLDRERMREHIAALCDVGTLVTESEAFLQQIATGLRDAPLVGRTNVI
jgi:glycosyltransferase involved in cell wall biosynthesis